MSQVLGVIVIARNGDRTSYHQDPKTYAGSPTETTALGEVESHQLGSFLRETYLSSGSPSFIEGISSDLVNNKEIKVRVKAGVEGTVVFDSAIALLQGLYPPNPNNKIVLANDTTVVAPLGGYQYVPVETVEPINDRSLESWTDCPAFQKHITTFQSSPEFKQKAADAQPFFKGVQDFVFGRPTTLDNIWNLYDFISSQLVHNKTYAYRLPPTLAEQARGLADWHENGVFSDHQNSGIGNIAGRTLLHTILTALERIAFNGDPLQFLLVETTYQPFISLFHEFDVIKEYPELAAIPDYASALTIELRRGQPPDLRDFLRFKFRNGTGGSFNTFHVFGHRADIPLTEFIYRAQGSAISSNKQWADICSGKAIDASAKSAHGLGFLDAGAVADNARQTAFNVAFAFVLIASLFLIGRFVRTSRAKARRPRLAGPEYMVVPSTEVIVEKTRLV